MGRVRVYDAFDLAANTVETFKDRPPEFEEDFEHEWPSELQHVGDSIGVAYRSDKWKPKDERRRRAYEDYCHLAESRNRLFWPSDTDFTVNGQRVDVPGPTVSFESVPMPDTFSILGLFLELRYRVHVGGTDSRPVLGKGDDGVVVTKVRHGMLGGGKIRWSKVSDQKDQPFLFVYTRSQGVLMLIVGDELDIEKDGIVG
jgi:hypothetical protein